jgi:tRNA-splicing ligase RtcB (3'-phosphate/5'-hydroxy nucleic acid ligase)
MNPPATVLIHADIIDDKAKEQIENISKSPAIQGLISIMPDVHAGEGCVIGFTGQFNHAVIPNIVGVDIGCGVSCHSLGHRDIDFKDLDDYIRKNIPMGFKSHENDHFLMSMPVGEFRSSIHRICDEVDNFYRMYPDVKRTSSSVGQIGTLGGGNHFIEIDEDSTGRKYIIVHSGSRNFGLKVANYFQSKAAKLAEDMLLDIPQGLEYLPMNLGGCDYIKWLHVAQRYAQISRRIMIECILNYFQINFSPDKYTESIHNFISPKDNIIRKGAISAREDEKVIIPLNMAEGCIIGIGKGRRDYNYSAPHGAGRLTGRKEMQRQLESGKVTMDAFKESMKGVFSTSIKESTIDESPFAYKRYESIEKHIDETVDVTAIMKPVYNLKSDEQ